jgi:hypothetical protein
MNEYKEERDFTVSPPGLSMEEVDDFSAEPVLQSPRSRRKLTAAKATAMKSKEKGSEGESQQKQDEADEDFDFQLTPVAKPRRAPKATPSRKGSKAGVGAAAARGRGRPRKPKDNDDEDDEGYKSESKKAASQKKKTSAAPAKRGGSAAGVAGRKRKATSPAPVARRSEDEQDEANDESGAISEPRIPRRRITFMCDIDDDEEATADQLVQQLKVSGRAAVSFGRGSCEKVELNFGAACHTLTFPL